MEHQPVLSVVIPAYNERQRLPAELDRWLTLLRSRGESFEVLVVDDGSRDGTGEYVEEQAKTNPELRLIRNPGNQGKGFSIRNGMLQARGARRLMSDADGATPPGEYYRLLQLYNAEIFPIVIGARIPLRGMTQVKRRLSRHYSGRIFATLMSILSGLRYYDTQCGFKLFSAQAAAAIFPHVECSRWAFDVEVLIVAEKLGFGVAEAPVNWEEMPGSKLSVFRSAPKMLWDVWRIRRRHTGGK